MAEAQAAVDLDVSAHGNADFRVEGAHAGLGFAAADGMAELFGQELGRLSVDLFQPCHRCRGLGERSGARRGQLAGRVDLFGQTQCRLGGAHRRRVPTAAGIHHQQVDGIAAHVEHA